MNSRRFFFWVRHLRRWLFFFLLIGRRYFTCYSPIYKKLWVCNVPIFIVYSGRWRWQIEATFPFPSYDHRSVFRIRPDGGMEFNRVVWGWGACGCAARGRSLFFKIETWVHCWIVGSRLDPMMTPSLPLTVLLLLGKSNTGSATYHPWPLSATHPLAQPPNLAILPIIHLLHL